MIASMVDVFSAWTKVALSQPGLLALAVAGAGLGVAIARADSRPPWLHRALLAALTLAGLVAVIDDASLFDDAYISFRYARNFADGAGLVFNAGERVEGYTNPLWTVLLGLMYRLTGLEPPVWALFGGPVIFLATLLVVDRTSAALSPKPDARLPIAAGLLAGSAVFVAYGTTGMETGLGALLAALGTLALVTERTARSAFLAGLAFILATFTRPDHALLYACGSAVIALEFLSSLRKGGNRKAAFIACLAYASPFLLYGAYLLWKVNFYGDLLPNTYYAKSAGSSWFQQGWVYVAAFGLGEGALFLALTSLGGLTGVSSPARRRFGTLALLWIPLHGVYVAKVGGDFMHGRFFVVALPMLAVGAALGFEQLAQRARTRPDARRMVLVGLAGAALMASTATVDLFRGEERWGILREHEIYQLRRWWPPAVKHRHDRVGRRLAKLHDAGLPVVLGTGGVGMVGYHSQLEVIDMRGLTDRTVAHQPLKKRTRPGHEKVAPRSYIRERGVDFLRLRAGQRKYHPKRFRKLTRLDLGRGIDDDWALARYDRDLLAKVREATPELTFVDLEKWLDKYIAGLKAGKHSPLAARETFTFLEYYYFNHNDDPERYAAFSCLHNRKEWADEPAVACGPTPAPVVIDLGADPIVLGAVGDINLGENASGRLKKHGGDWVFAALQGTLDGVDLTLGNLETAVANVATECPPEKSSIHLMKPRYLDALKNHGIGLVTLGNNHAMDQGPGKLAEMMGHLDAAGIAHIGAGLDRDEARRAVVVQGGGARIGILGSYQSARSYRRIGFYATDDRPGVNVINTACTRVDVDGLKAQGVDIVVASVHWGNNYRQENRAQRAMARKLVGAGADVILGHGGHLAQGVEVIDGVPVVYGLGNHVFGSRGLYGKQSPDLRSSLIAKLHIADGELTAIEVQAIRTDNTQVGYQPRPSTAEEAQEVLPLLRRYGLEWTALGPGRFRLDRSQWESRGE